MLMERDFDCHVPFNTPSEVSILETSSSVFCLSPQAFHHDRIKPPWIDMTRSPHSDPSPPTSTIECVRHYNNMSHVPEFLSEEAERALRGEEEGARRIFEQSGYLSQPSAGVATTLLIDPRWDVAHTSVQGREFFHPDPSQADFSAWVVGQGPFTPLPGPSNTSGSSSPKPADLDDYGFLNDDQRTWRCAYPSCASKAVFSRPCDLRKHFNRHSKSFFCRHDGCPQATEGGFSSKKDRARHEASHNPGVTCEWEGCERVFSRVDNMKDHVRRIHRKGA